MMTVTVAPDERIHLQQGAILLQDQILGYIAWRAAHSHSYVDMSRDMNMTDGWVGEHANATIQVMRLDTRKKVSAALAKKYGAEGIPILHARPTVVPAPKPVEALNRGFGPKGGDPSRPLAPVQQEIVLGTPVEDLGSEEEAELASIEEEVAFLLEEKTPQELAELVVQFRDHARSLGQQLRTVKQDLVYANDRIGSLASQVTSMDNIRIRLGAEIVERNETIKGQAQDMAEYEKAMDILQQKLDELQAFKDTFTEGLRPFAIFLAQLVEVDIDLSGVQTGRYSALGEMGAAAHREYIGISEASTEWPRIVGEMG